MTARLVLIAHGSTDAVRRGAFGDDEPLGPVGIQAAEALALGLHHSARVFTSTARRCTQTCAALGLNAHPDAVLDDWDLGRWRGRSVETVTADQPDEVGRWLTDPDAIPHSGESLSALIIRADGLPARIEAAEDGITVTITHPAVIRAAIVSAVQAGARSFWRIDVAPLTATTLIGHDGRWNLRATGQPLDSVALLNR
jgi:broad specificity phosphatase PhoE